ncbi:MAG: ribonuclease R [Xanthomonadales bacterium]|nr:ribonuclease R [Xanthomonadales bacterium]NNL94442.1 ribonuclease R [Xanthomonadales bacterium]
MPKKNKHKESRSPNRKGRGHIDSKAPDRQAILDLLGQSDGPLQRKEVVAELNVESDGSREILRRRLRAMVRDGQLIKNRRNAYGLSSKMDLVKGTISAHADGFGFVMPESGGDDLYLSPRQMRNVLHGDRVLASVVGVDRRGRKEGAIREVLERAHDSIVGRFIEESGVAFVVPDNPKINHEIIIPLKDSHGAQPGQVVVARLVTQPDGHKPPVGKIEEILGRAGAPGMATEIAIRDFGLPHEFPDDVEREAAKLGDEVAPHMAKGRMDLRDLPLVTIDGADARDFDDAVYASNSKNGWRLVVAIADVSSYVTPGSALEREARERATSVYFPSRVIPMLPESLSNGLCSLKPGVDRLCLVCDMTIGENGTVTRSRFAAGIMHSHARLTYNQVKAYLDGGQLPERASTEKVQSSLDCLFDLYRALAKSREQRGAIAFESSETRFEFDRNGAVTNLLNYERHEAHMLIEECMIMANVEAARLMEKLKWPAPFRVHAPPPKDKLEPLERFLRAQGLKPNWKVEPAPKDFCLLLEQAKGRPDHKLIMAVLLRAQSLAVYQNRNQGHFGLALDAYAHFTSPIRRYPDLVLHRTIHHFLSRKNDNKPPFDEDALQRICSESSERSRRAEEAERDVSDRLKCAFMERHVGDQFDGMISGVTSFGLFVELDMGGVNGLVHVTGLPNDYYHFDPDHHRLTGERRGRSFRLADRVRVEVSSVNVSDRKIDFNLVE